MRYQQGRTWWDEAEITTKHVSVTGARRGDEMALSREESLHA